MKLLLNNLIGKYCKYSKEIKAVSVYDMPKKVYINYWVNLYSRRPKQYLSEIKKTATDKLENGCISADCMIKLIESSKDRQSEKDNAISLLRGGKIVVQPVVKRNNYLSYIQK